MKSNREDKRGHWPAGKRRNNQPPPKGWPSVEQFLQDVNDFCRNRRQVTALAEHLGVHRRTVDIWLQGEKWPSRSRMVAIARWYRAKTRHKARHKA